MGKTPPWSCRPTKLCRIDLLNTVSGLASALVAHQLNCCNLLLTHAEQVTNAKKLTRDSIICPALLNSCSAKPCEDLDLAEVDESLATDK